MCHRFNLRASERQLADFLKSFPVVRIPQLPLKDYYPLYDILVLRMVDDDEWIVEPRSWGFLPRSWKPTDRCKTAKAFQRGKINARSETVDTTWPWKFSFPTQRCMMLATSFYEPYREGGDGNYSLPGNVIFGIPGLWDNFEGDDGKGNLISVESCVMLTTDANPLVESTRKGRMRQPAIMTDPEDIQRYCSLEITEHEQLANLFSPWPDTSMDFELDVKAD